VVGQVEQALEPMKENSLLATQAVEEVELSEAHFEPEGHIVQDLTDLGAVEKVPLGQPSSHMFEEGQILPAGQSLQVEFPRKDIYPEAH